MYEITDRYGTTNHEFTDYEILEKLGRVYNLQFTKYN